MGKKLAMHTSANEGKRFGEIVSYWNLIGSRSFHASAEGKPPTRRRYNFASVVQVRPIRVSLMIHAREERSWEMRQILGNRIWSFRVATR